MVEVLVATSIFALIVGAVMNTLVTAQQSYLMRANTVDSQQKLRLGIARLTQDIREAGYRATVTSAFAAITAQSATGLTIQNDWNDNGVIEPAITVMVNGVARGERTVYSLVGGTLQRQESGVDAAPVPLADGIQQLTFEYRDANNAITATDTAIRAVAVSINAEPVTQTASGRGGAVRIAMTDRMRLRNR